MNRIVVGEKIFACPFDRAAVIREEVGGRRSVKIALLGSYEEIKETFAANISYRQEWDDNEGRSYGTDLGQYSIPGEITDCRDGSFLLTMYAPTAAEKLEKAEMAFADGVNGCMDAEAPALLEALAQAAYFGARSQALALADAAPGLTDTEIIDSESLVPEWRPGPQKAGSLVKRTALDQVYRILQTHDSSQNPDWTPEAQPALFGICHTTDPAKAKPWVDPQGTSGLYQANECYKDADGAVWRQTYGGENEFDAAALPERWERVE